MRKIFILLLVSLSIVACETDFNNGKKVQGMKPVYIPLSEINNIYSANPQTLQRPGKIFMIGNKLFIVEKAQGVHIVNNSDPSNPIKESFIKIPGVIDVSVKSNILYADNLSDLVAIDISNIFDVQVVKRVKDVYPATANMYPEFYEGYFECVDTTQGYVVDWILADLTDPKCRK